MASGSDDGSFSIWNLRMLKVCIDSEVKDWWLFFFSPLIKGVGGWWCWVAYTHFFLIKVEESSTVLLFMTNMTFLFSFRKMMLLWHISSITSIQLHLLNGVRMNLLHWQFHHRITNWRGISSFKYINYIGYLFTHWPCLLYTLSLFWTEYGTLL